MDEVDLVATILLGSWIFLLFRSSRNRLNSGKTWTPAPRNWPRTKFGSSGRWSALSGGRSNPVLMKDDPWKSFSFDPDELSVDEARWFLVWQQWEMPPHLFDKTAVYRATPADEVDEALDNLSPAYIADLYHITVRELRMAVIEYQNFTVDKLPSATMFL